MMHWTGWNHGMASWGWIFQILILVAFFLIFWWLVKQNQSPYRANSAEEILKKRLARGEIDEEEYKSLKKEIE